MPASEGTQSNVVRSLCRRRKTPDRRGCDRGKCRVRARRTSFAPPWTQSMKATGSGAWWTHSAPRTIARCGRWRFVGDTSTARCRWRKVSSDRGSGSAAEFNDRQVLPSSVGLNLQRDHDGRTPSHQDVRARAGRRSRPTSTRVEARQSTHGTLSDANLVGSPGAERLVGALASEPVHLRLKPHPIVNAVGADAPGEGNGEVGEGDRLDGRGADAGGPAFWQAGTPADSGIEHGRSPGEIPGAK